MHLSRFFRKRGSLLPAVFVGMLLSWFGCTEEEDPAPAILIEVTLEENAMSLDGKLNVLKFMVAYPAGDQKDDVAEPLYVTDSEITGTEVDVSGRSLSDSPFKILIKRDPEMKADSIKVFVVGYAEGNKAAFGVLANPNYQRFFEGEVVSRTIRLERVYEGALPFEITKHGCVIEDGGKIMMASPVDRDCDGYTVAEGDCDDDDPNVNPGVVDNVCDGKDSSCGHVNNVHGTTEDCYVVSLGQDNQTVIGCYEGVRTCDDMAGGGWGECVIIDGSRPVSDDLCDLYLECLELFPEDPMSCMEQTKPPEDILCYVYMDSQDADKGLCEDFPIHPLPEYNDALVCNWTLQHIQMGTDDWEIGLTTDTADTPLQFGIESCAGVKLVAIPPEPIANADTVQVKLKLVKDGVMRDYNVTITAKPGNCENVDDGMYCTPDFPF